MQTKQTYTIISLSNKIKLVQFNISIICGIIGGENALIYLHWLKQTMLRYVFSEVFRSKFQFVKTKCQLNQTTIFQAFGAQKRRSLQRAPN